MKSQRHRITLPVLTALALSATALAQPQEVEPEEDRWYNVELIIFSRTSASASTAEVWEPLPQLEYPSKYRYLQPPGYKAVVKQTQGEAEQEGLSDQASQLANDQALDPNQVSPEPIRPRPTPFVRLPDDQWEFVQRARRMQQSGRFDILFHERWNQPVLSSGRTLPIILDTSGYRQEWPKLQGSIKLHLARYLHLEANFWVNTTGSYLPGDWQMPAPPLGPVPGSMTATEEMADPLLTGDETEVVEDLKPIEALSNASETTEDSGPSYPWRHAVLLQQKRKMRSKEVHYIDHPMMGAIILITPISDEELDALAIEELGLDPNQPLYQPL